ncbi:MAG: FAD-dependent oxidoreductase [Planctomycetota bacterium]
MPTPSTTDLLVVGGGILGLSIAYESASSGRSVRLIERGRPGREASWAGAGILPPGSWFSEHPAVERLAEASRPLHGEWSVALREATGVDDEHEVTGALYQVCPDKAEWLESKFSRWREQGLASRRVSAADVERIAPGARIGEAYFVPDEAQVRNPRRLAALRAVCEARGVTIESDAGAESFDVSGGRIASLGTARGRFAAADFCIAAGAWSGSLAERLRISLPTKPVRGQMALLRSPRRGLKRIVHCGGRYLVPRRDGRVLVGSTVEDVGFDKRTVDAVIAELVAFARDTIPRLADAEVEAAWSGLRPASADGLPMIGRLPGLANGWIAAGHFRSGLQFAPATAVAMRQLLNGEPPCCDLADFAPDRFAAVAP